MPGRQADPAGWPACDPGSSGDRIDVAAVLADLVLPDRGAAANVVAAAPGGAVDERRGPQDGRQDDADDEPELHGDSLAGARHGRKRGPAT
jgi:hypothetical protein